MSRRLNFVIRTFPAVINSTPGGTYSNYKHAHFRHVGPKNISGVLIPCFHRRGTRFRPRHFRRNLRKTQTSNSQLPLRISCSFHTVTFSTITVLQMCEGTDLLASYHNAPPFVSHLGLVGPLRTNI